MHVCMYYVHLDQKVPGITTRWCSESADLNSVFLIRLPLSIIDIPTKFYHHSLTFVKVTPSWVYLPLHVFSILDLWENNSWILHHVKYMDNAPSHSAIIIREFLTKNETNNIQQSSNSPDMAPADFFLFDRVKKPLRGKTITRFNSRKEVMEKSKTALMATDNRVPEMFESWIKRWHKL